MLAKVQVLAVYLPPVTPPSIARNLKNDYTLDLLSVGLFFSSILLVTATCNYLSKKLQPRIQPPPKNLAPCRNCRYFNSNYHLKCAVHPSSVLTEKAMDCRDYDRT